MDPFQDRNGLFLSLPIVPNPKNSFLELRMLLHRGANSVSPPSQSLNQATVWLGGAPTCPGVPCSGLGTLGFLCCVAVPSAEGLCFSGSSHPARSRVKSPGAGQAPVIPAV